MLTVSHAQVIGAIGLSHSCTARQADTLGSGLQKRMSNGRRKHVLQNSLTGHVEPPTEGQQIVRAVGSRGGNIVEVGLQSPHPYP